MFCWRLRRRGHFEIVMKARLALLILLLPLAACVGKTALPADCAANVMCAARSAEPEQLSPGQAERNGDQLVLFPAQGQKVTFTDHLKACDDGVVETCIGFALMDKSDRGGAFIVQQFYYEGSVFLLIDSQTGRSTTLHGMPQFSPDGSRFLVAPFDEESDVGINNLEIWRREGDGAVLEWSHTFAQAHAEDPNLKAPYKARVSGWTYNRIGLALQEAGSERRWRGSITRDETGWHLSAVSPR
jgi:hypothetical protein